MSFTFKAFYVIFFTFLSAFPDLKSLVWFYLLLKFPYPLLTWVWLRTTLDLVFPGAVVLFFVTHLLLCLTLVVCPFVDFFHLLLDAIFSPSSFLPSFFLFYTWLQPSVTFSFITAFVSGRISSRAIKVLVVCFFFLHSQTRWGPIYGLNTRLS